MNSSATLRQRIDHWVDKRNALILAHNYQPDSIQQLAHCRGDSLALAQSAADSDAEVIVFCGVHFMAESAAVLAPQKQILLPVAEAGCPMADMITPQDVQQLRQEHPGAPVVAYVNTSAAVKATSDICCTSANAVSVVNSLPEEEVILIPDRNLGQYIARHTHKTCHIYQGYCPTHDEVTAAQLEQVQQAHPQAWVLAHPECPPAVLDRAQHVFSTSGILQFVRQQQHQEFIIATERGILCQLQEENPNKAFYFPATPFLCPDMKRMTPADVLAALETLTPRITVPSELAGPARRSLERMLAIPRD